MKQEVLAAITIQPMETIEELEMVKTLEELVWSKEEAVPVNQTIAAVKNGGFVLGAFIGEELIGFQYSFPGFDGKRIYLCSHSLAIHPNYRKYGIGEKLKCAQKKLAREKGYDQITWTYDPLETVNAYLNLHKLGAVCSTYLENVYGEMQDSLNAGLPTDRFYVEWETAGPINKFVPESDSPHVIQTIEQDGFIIPKQSDLTLSNELLYVPVPGNFQEMKKQDFSLAAAWRKSTKEVFLHYFNLGWKAVDLVKDPHHPNQYLYLLRNEGIKNGD